MENRFVYRDGAQPEKPRGYPFDGHRLDVPAGEKTNPSEARTVFLQGLDLMPEKKDNLFNKILENFNKDGAFRSFPKTENDMVTLINKLRKDALEVALANSNIWTEVQKDSAPDALRKILEMSNNDFSMGVADIFAREVRIKLTDLQIQHIQEVGIERYFTVEYSDRLINVKSFTKEEKEAVEKTQVEKKENSPENLEEGEKERKDLAKKMAKSPFYTFLFSFLGLLKPHDKKDADSLSYDVQFEQILSGANPTGWLATLFLPLPGSEEKRKKITDNAGEKSDLAKGVFDKVDEFLNPFKSIMDLDGTSGSVKKIAEFFSKELNVGGSRAFTEATSLKDSEVIPQTSTFTINVPKLSFVDLKYGARGLNVKNSTNGELLEKLGRLDAAQGPLSLTIDGGQTLAGGTVFGKGVTVALTRLSSDKNPAPKVESKEA